MSVVVIGSSLADSDEFCKRNPDFKRAVRASAYSMSWFNVVVSEFVLTPRARMERGARREQVRKAGMTAAFRTKKQWFGHMRGDR